MALFWTDSITLCCSNVEACKKWWIESLECKQAEVPGDWDNVLPSAVALTLPEGGMPTILLSDWVEIRQAGYERSNNHPVLFSSKLKKAHEYLGGAKA